MRLEIIASNMTQVHVGNAIVLFSYNTPVAAVRPNNEGKQTFYQTEAYFPAPRRSISTSGGSRGIHCK